jgi:transcription initiation factor TFIIIB Brf1 subunit/transcription initiation factor TFIIB
MGEYVCQGCARVVMEQIDDHGPESNSSDFYERSKNTRATGYTNYSMHDYGLRTEIGSTSKDYAGKGTCLMVSIPQLDRIIANTRKILRIQCTLRLVFARIGIFCVYYY